MISIITAVHNQLEFNKLFIKYLEKNTHHPYELIIVDNHSTDGSTEFFEERGAIVIRNAENHCYPESQNMGMERAKYDYFAFLNNDICVAPDWDKLAIEAMHIHQLDVASLGSWEVVEDPYLRHGFHRKWKWLRRGKNYLAGDLNSLENMMNRLYQEKSFEEWSKTQYELHYPRVYMGVCGSAVFTTRRAWDILGGNWDVRMEAADWDLHMRTTQRAIKYGDIRPPHMIPWALHHHFSRVTFRNQPEPRECDHQHLAIKDKWSEEDISLFGPKQLQERGFYTNLRRVIKAMRVSRKSSREDV